MRIVMWAIAAACALVVLAGWALCAFAGSLDDQAGWGDPPFLPYHCTQVRCAAEMRTLADVDRHLWDSHGIRAVNGVRVP